MDTAAPVPATNTQTHGNLTMFLAQDGGVNCL